MLGPIHKVHLDSVRKHRNAQEWRNVNRATCGDYVSTGDGCNIGNVAKQMMQAGVSSEIEVWRGETLVFRPAPIKTWADGKFGKGDQPEHLKRKQPC